MHRVLVVDNEAIIRRGMIQCMDWAALDCQVVADAADGAEALRLLEQHPVDILITDIRMPGMDGLELTRQVRALYPDIKVIMVTAFSEFKYAQEAVRQQVVDFIIKPTSEEKIREAVQRAKDLLNSDLRVGELVRTLHSKQQDNLALEQQLFVEGLISGDPPSNLYVRTQSARLRLELPGSRVLAVQIHGAQLLEEDQTLRCLQESSRFLQQALPENSVITLSPGSGRFLALALQMEEQRLRAGLNVFFGLIDGFAEYRVQMGVSGPAEDAYALKEAARQAQDALHSLAYDEHKPLLFYDEVPAVNGRIASALQAALKQAREALQAQDMHGVEQSVHVFEEHMRQGLVPPADVQRYARLLYSLCAGLLLDYDLARVMDTDSFPTEEQFMDRVARERIGPPFLELARATVLLLRGDGQSREETMQFLQNYIDQNLACDLSLEGLAKLVHLSPSYLSKEFKRARGQNISTYIGEKRMERAKALMRSPDLKNYEIARLVGIEDPVYFSRAFKKATGMRPSEYRSREK